MALGTPLCECSGPGDIHGDPPQLVLETALGPPYCPMVEAGLWAWGQLQDSLGDCPLPRSARGGCVCRGAGLGDTPGDPPDAHHCRGCRVEGRVLVDLLPEAWGWGTILQTPTSKKQPRTTDELWDRNVGSRPPSIPFARGGHFGGCPWRPPVLRVGGWTQPFWWWGWHIWDVESPCQRDTARVTPRTLRLSWLGCTGILLPRVSLFRGQDCGDPFSWDSI